MAQMSNRKRLLIEEVVFPEAEEIYAAALDVFYALPDEKRRSYRGQSAPLEGRDERLRLVRRAHEEQLHQLHALHCKQPITGEIMDRAPMLEVIIVPGSGADLVDLDAATDRAIAVICGRGAAYVPVAEHVIGLMLAAAKKIAVTDRNAHLELASSRAGEALLRYGMPSVISEKTIGIVGFGFIGRALAQMCAQGFAMEVLAHDPYFDRIEARRQGVTLVSDLDEMLPRCDFVSLNCVLTPETRHLIDGRRLALMKPTAMLINAARGGVVDTGALLAALEDGTIAAAGLDCVDPEPLPAGHRIFSLDNVVLTPHIGGIAAEFHTRMAVQIATDAVAALRGERGGQLANPAVWDAFSARMARSS